MLGPSDQGTFSSLNTWGLCGHLTQPPNKALCAGIAEGVSVRTGLAGL